MKFAVGIMLGFDEQDLKISDGGAGDAGDQMGGAVGQQLKKAMRVVILHELGRVQPLVRRHLNRVVVHEYACFRVGKSFGSESLTTLFISGL